MNQHNTPEDVLQHFGILGMRWGVRREDDAKTGRVSDTPSGKSGIKKASTSSKLKDAVKTTAKKALPSQDHLEAHGKKTQAKLLGVETLSNKEIQAVVRRLKLERDYKSEYESSYALGKAAKWIREWLDDVSRRGATTWISNPLAVGSAAGRHNGNMLRDAIEGEIVGPYELEG